MQILSVVNLTDRAFSFEGLPGGGVIRPGVGTISEFSISDPDFLEQAINAGLEDAVNANLLRVVPTFDRWERYYGLASGVLRLDGVFEINKILAAEIEFDPDNGIEAVELGAAVREVAGVLQDVAGVIDAQLDELNGKVALDASVLATNVAVGAVDASVQAVDASVQAVETSVQAVETSVQAVETAVGILDTEICARFRDAFADAFGDLVTSNKIQEINVAFRADLDPFRVGVRNVGTATVTHMGDRSQARLRVAAIGDKATVRTYSPALYRAAQGMRISQTGGPLSSRVGCAKRIGYFSDTDGIFVANIDGAGLSLVIRSKVTGTVVERVIARADWNIDKLDGNGPSACTLDDERINVQDIEFQYLGHGIVLLGFFVGRQKCWVHEERHVLNDDVPYMRSGSQPIAWEIEALAGFVAGDGPEDIYATCGSVIRLGAREEPGATGYYLTSTFSVVTAGSAGEVAFLLRRRADYQHAVIYLKHIELINLGVNPIEYVALLNPTLGGAAPVWSGFAGGLGIGEISVTAGITATGGVMIGGGFSAAGSAAGRGSNVVQEVSSVLPIAGEFLGDAAQVVAIVVRQISGASTARLAVGWTALK